MMPSQVKGTHAFCPSNTSVGAVHTLKSSAAVGRSHWEPALPLHTSDFDADQANPIDHNNALPIIFTSPIHPPPPSVTSVRSSNSTKCKCSTLDNMISTSGGNSEGGGSSKCSGLKPSGPVALNAVAAQLGEFTNRFEKVMMP